MLHLSGYGHWLFHGAPDTCDYSNLLWNTDLHLKEQFKNELQKYNEASIMIGLTVFTVEVEWHVRIQSRYAQLQF